ncbi:GxxExxY protein [Patescibacteria group bacterium]|nr:GxxExxY protein [Patescibacteria group bacterium]
MYKESDLTQKIIGIAMRIHCEIGPGFQEKIYHRAMMIALENDGMIIESEKEYNINFENIKVGVFRADLVVENKVIIELKAVVGEMPKIFQTQTISYLKASGLEVGLLINFNNQSLEVKRLANYKNYKKFSGICK